MLKALKEVEGMYKIVLFLHVVFAMLWIGGMIFNLVFLHPSMGVLKQQETRKELARSVLKRFFLGVWVSVLGLFLTGMWMWHEFRPDFNTNTLFHIKLFLFTIMVVNLAYISLYLFRRGLFKHIPNFVWINLLLGLGVTFIITYIR